MGTLASNVQVKQATLITPSDPTHSHILKLSAIDSQLFLRFTIEYLLIYQFNNIDKEDITRRVKTALARALVPYYPLAGRVRARADGTSLEVVCRGQGAVFIEASSDFTVSEFEKAPRYVTEWRNLLALQVTDLLKGAPPLVVQLTWLSDGGVAVGVGFSHCICDGVGSLEFLNLFAKLAVGSKTVSFKPKPVWQRHLLDPTTSFKLDGSHATEVARHPEFKIVNDYCKFMTRFATDELSPTSVTFDEWRLNELKNTVTEASQIKLASVTTFEALSAHIWRTWAIALNFPPNQTLKLLFSINIRLRVKPSLPTGYYGNAIVLGCAQTTAKELTENGLAYAAELIKEAKNRVDDKFVREVVNSVSLNGASCVPDPVGVLILSEWSKLGLERVDFGIGRPVNVGPVCTDRYCILLRGHDHNRSVKVMLAVPSLAVDKYLDLLTAVQ